jgi:hypothetical protein
VPVAENGTFFERRLHTGAVGHRNPFRVPLRAEEKIPECQKNRVFTGLRNPVVGKLSSPEKLWQMMDPPRHTAAEAAERGIAVFPNFSVPTLNSTMSVSDMFSEFLGNLVIQNSETISLRYGELTAALNKQFRETESKTANTLQVTGAVAIAIGVGLIFLPAGLVVAGLAAILFGISLENK